LASRVHHDVAGRAFLFLTFEFHNDEDCTYRLAGDRLIAVEREMKTRIRQMSDVQVFDVRLELKSGAEP
jgi:hypothetical protein